MNKKKVTLLTQQIHLYKISRFIFIVGLSLFLLTSCSNEYEEKIRQNHDATVARMMQLGDALDSSSLTNAKIVTLYSNKLGELKPELDVIAQALAFDATRKGALYQGLKSRLSLVNLKPENKQEYVTSLDSLSSIYAGSDPLIFNDALLDLINTMADLSDGKLARISIPKSTQVANVKGEGIVPGSYLVGNPAYGSYQQNSSGQSFWHWYGQYAFFRSMFSGPSYYNRPISYGGWNSSSRYSYYNDYGRGAYGSNRDRSYASTENSKMRSKGITVAKPKKQYGSVQGRKRTSTYSSNRKNMKSNLSKKFGSSNGPRHVNKGSTKRSSSLFSSNKSRTSSSSQPRRSSSLFGSSSRSSYSRSSFSRGGK